MKPRRLAPTLLPDPQNLLNSLGIMDILGPFEEPDVRILMPGSSAALESSETDEDLSESGKRKYRSFTIMQKAGFQHTEYVRIMLHLCNAELVISSAFMAHGMWCPGFPDVAEYQSTCHMNAVGALVGIFAALIGIGAVNRFRWRTVIIAWLVMCIIGAVGNLLAVITDGIWLDHLSKMKERTALASGLSGLMLLSSVAVGVCFILTAVMICHYWNSNSPRYQPVGKFSKRSRSVRRRLTRLSSGQERKRIQDKAIKGAHIV
ncbi:unnamed protein product, partial [Mesorhabditis belari]|uniref:Uncharacterized protein n=1 Tax=Mesorhabditis belari TaxID=2138241 RepID=A0AAF3J985_9BILA